MPRTEFAILLAIMTIIVMVFILGIVLFFVQYRKYKMAHIRETMQLNELHARELLSAQIEIQQQTMHYIGREIHDSVGQKLTLASLYNQLLSHTFPNSGFSAQLLAIGNCINESLDELRNLSKSLTSEQPGDLLPLLQKECEKINLTGICIASIRSDLDTLVLPQMHKNIVLRIVQESVQNSLKHSGCQNIRLELRNEPNSTTLSITDDGRGFDPNSPAISQNGIGLGNMRRRAAAIGALLTLNAAVGKGATIHLSLPHQ
jgi:signal transduction histidine kinase